jgi:hypothetical protein
VEPVFSSSLNFGILGRTFPLALSFAGAGISFWKQGEQRRLFGAIVELL